METLHTYGDWYAKEGQIVAQDTGKTLAIVPYYDNTDEEQTANANLMAASPRLLQAAENALSLLVTLEIRGDAQRGLREAIQQATNR
jgi:hypothetical protein